MASKTIQPIYVFLLLLPFLCVSRSNNPETELQIKLIKKLSNALAYEGYFAMSVLLDFAMQQMSETLEDANVTRLTLFCPKNIAFSQRKYHDPSLTLLKYHAVPSKLDKRTFDSAPYRSKIDTLLDGIPLLITSIPHDGLASINLVKITHWNVYDDEEVIVHGIEEIFGPMCPALCTNETKQTARTLFLLMKNLIINSWLFYVSCLILLVVIICHLCNLRREPMGDEYFPLRSCPEEYKL